MGAMAIHVIRIPDRMRGREVRTIRWDDGAGTVDGDHSYVIPLGAILAAAPVDEWVHEGTLTLRDPAHDPADFLAALCLLYWPIGGRDRLLLPPTLRHVEPTPVVVEPMHEILPDGSQGRELRPGADFLH